LEGRGASDAVRIIRGTQAWARATRKTLAGGAETPFALTEDDRFFLVGTCLARDMERALRVRGLTVLSTCLASPTDETSVGLTPVDRTKIPALTEEFRFAFGAATFPPEAFSREEDGLWRDLLLPGGIRAVTRERIEERRLEMKRYFARVLDATVVLIDLSGVDAWFDTQAGLTLSVGPSYWAARREPDRFEYRVYNVEDFRAAVLELLDLLREFVPGVRFILTVNPMSLAASFRGGDVQSVETSWKATMRVVAGELAGEHDDVAYYPTFELFTFPPRSEVFHRDGVHVLPAAIDVAIAGMLRDFGIERAPTEPDFVESAYLRANPDLAARVRAGTLVSGYHHWLAEGRAEGRPLVVPACQVDDPIAPEDMQTKIVAAIPERAETATQMRLRVDVANTGAAAFATSGRLPVHFSYRWYDESGVQAEPGRSLHTALEDVLLGGESTRLAPLVVTPRVAGRYTLALSLVQHDVAWFDDIDPASGLRVPMTVGG
jgi:uncharacterized protein YcfL